MTINPQAHLAQHVFDTAQLKSGGTRDGFGIGLVEAAEADERVVGLCADLTESVRMTAFAEKFPNRFFQVGVAEQNLVTVASGMAAAGKIPFAGGFAAFSPGRNWEQIRTTICYNDQPVKIVGSHTGLSVGEDGATHQMLEDMAIMRVLPNMVVVVPVDVEQARLATLAIAKDPRPTYIRLTREKFPIFTTPETPFEIGKAQVLLEGTDVTIVGCGAVLYEALLAAKALEGEIRVEVINAHTVKPLDAETILASVRKTGCVVTIEEHQVIGGLGGAVAELLAEHEPAPLERMGTQDTFGESGTTIELWKHYGLTSTHIIDRIRTVLKKA
ncbi:MAG: transketolase family protein [Candidatus Kerfeldbacteria bacterium]|nr:transketolase family protein [Candidatus Kerfeldbacteria bacterium]